MESMKTILVIDDDTEVLGSLKQTLEEEFDGVVVKPEQDFRKGMRRMASCRPDAVVLDLRRGTDPSNLPGQETWRAIWNKRFCPIVIYTAGDGDLDPPLPEDHPFVKLVTKGSNAEDLLVKELRAFLPCIDEIAELRNEIDDVMHQVLRDTAGTGAIDPQEENLLLHAGRRRIAASMDAPTIASQHKLLGWEQYLIPAIGDSPLTADLICEHGAEWDDPSAYRLVLTPSCDLVRGRNEQTLITARCEASSRLIDNLSLSNNREKATKRVRERVLIPGVHNGYVPLPAFPQRVPVMVANLKSLEVIEYDAIGGSEESNSSFERIASIDSPFREQVAWAFLTTAARPGMPDRALDQWAEELIEQGANAIRSS